MSPGPPRAGGWALVALLALGPAPAARAVVYLTPTQAQERLLPDHDAVRKVLLSPSAAQQTWLEQQLGYRVARPRYIWRVAEQAGQPVGYLLLDNELGKHEPITFAVALNAAGQVSSVAVCVYRESRGDEVRRAAFMRQFVGKGFGDPLRLDREVTHVSGATISSRSAVAVVNRALALWRLQFGDIVLGAAAAGASE